MMYISSAHTQLLATILDNHCRKFCWTVLLQKLAFEFQVHDSFSSRANLAPLPSQYLCEDSIQCSLQQEFFPLMLVGTLFLALSFLLVLSQASICALHIYTISTQPKDCGESSANCWGFLSLPISDLQILATLASTNSELSSQLLDITDSIWVPPPHAED